MGALGARYVFGRNASSSFPSFRTSQAISFLPEIAVKSECLFKLPLFSDKLNLR